VYGTAEPSPIVFALILVPEVEKPHKPTRSPVIIKYPRAAPLASCQKQVPLYMPSESPFPVLSRSPSRRVRHIVIYAL
jgi:hypothetical protein